MAASRSSYSKEPLWRWPLIKKVGVPLTPLRTLGKIGADARLVLLPVERVEQFGAGKTSR